jgi:hypothetical protein
MHHENNKKAKIITIIRKSTIPKITQNVVELKKLELLVLLELPVLFVFPGGIGTGVLVIAHSISFCNCFNVKLVGIVAIILLILEQTPVHSTESVRTLGTKKA